MTIKYFKCHNKCFKLAFNYFNINILWIFLCCYHLLFQHINVHFPMVITAG